MLSPEGMLVIDRKKFTTVPRKNLTKLCQDLCFLGSHSIFNNLHKAPFLFDGTQYSCTEQHMQCSKVHLFDVTFPNNRIMWETNPYKFKQIGSMIKNHQEEKQKSAAKQIVIKVSTQTLLSSFKIKFTRNFKGSRTFENCTSIRRSVLGDRSSFEGHWLSLPLMFLQQWRNNGGSLSSS